MTETKAEIVEALQEEYKTPPSLINAGLCEQFAKDLKAKFDGQYSETATILTTADIIDPSKTPTSHLDSYPTHYFVRCGTQCYDAECPEGVENVLHLPFFDRIEHLINPAHLQSDGPVVYVDD